MDVLTEKQDVLNKNHLNSCVFYLRCVTPQEIVICAIYIQWTEANKMSYYVISVMKTNQVSQVKYTY